ncbi:MAG: hypothetical protein E7L40_03480 [Corynebacterium kroppenstedtii]|uniref:hypothetical protein n=1 Tax=Corynebacterium kroppenstedtii TaxID=161879 RepID=UPI00206DCC73|nr:hypothetical protein [Corynebacterium kroppenstedtii]MDU7286668.1 hypothetical protein [Corynebacterium kroppenstedtii]DAW73618.1 MAG TPA: hypothetical protein [Caudoviricetes sp.]
MGVCLSEDSPAGAWAVGRPMLNAVNEAHALFFGQDDYTTGWSAMEALIPALHT